MSRDFIVTALKALGIKFGSVLLTFLLMVYASQRLGSIAFGEFAFAFSLANLIGLIFSFGCRNFALKNCAIAAADVGSRSEIFVFLVVLMSIVFGAGLPILLWFESGFDLVPDEVGQGVVLLAILVSVSEVFAHYFRGYKGVIEALIFKDVIWKISSLAILYFASDLSAAKTIEIMSLCLFVCTLAQILRSRGEFMLKEVSVTEIQGKCKRWLKECVSFWGGSVIRGGVPHLSVVVIGLALTELETGVFFAAWKLASLMNIFTMGANMVLAPQFAREFSAGNLSRVQVLCRYGIMLTGIPCVIATIVFVTFGGELLALFSEEYSVGAFLLIIMAVGVMLNSLCGSTMQLMEMSGAQNYYLRSIAITNGVAIACLIVVPKFFVGLESDISAIILSASIFLWNLPCIFYLRAKYHVDPTLLSIFKRNR